MAMWIALQKFLCHHFPAHRRAGGGPAGGAGGVAAAARAAVRWRRGTLTTVQAAAASPRLRYDHFTCCASAHLVQFCSVGMVIVLDSQCVYSASLLERCPKLLLHVRLETLQSSDVCNFMSTYFVRHVAQLRWPRVRLRQSRPRRGPSAMRCRRRTGEPWWRTGSRCWQRGFPPCTGWRWHATCRSF